MNTAFKYSGVDWLGNVPSDWKVLALKRYAPYISRGISPDYTDDPYKSIPIINQTCIYWDGLRLENVKFQDPNVTTGFRGRVYPDDLLINSTGTGTLGRIGVFNLDSEYLADSHVTIIRLAREVFPQYLYYLLQTDVYQGYIYSVLASGATNQIELSREGLSNTPIIVPPSNQQKSIAHFLDRKTAAIDTLIAKKQRLIKLLEEKRTALINQAVTKGLNPNAPMKDSGIPWIGKIPEHWEALKLKRFANVSYGLTLELDRNEVNGTFIISLPNITKDGRLMLENVPKTPLSCRVKNELLLEKGDLLFNWRNGSSDHVGKTAYFEAKGEYIHVSFLLRIRMNKTQNNPRYFHMYLGHLRNTGFFSAAKTRVNNSFNQEELNSLEVMLPPCIEQADIATYLKNETSKIDNIVSMTQTSIEKLQEYRRSLITAAVTGKLDVKA